MTARLRIELFVRNVDAFVDFYTRVLGFAVRTDGRDSAHPYVAVRRDDIEVGASPSWEPVDPVVRSVPAGVELVIEVDDLDAEERRVTEARWPIESPKQQRPWGLTDFRVHDPDGYYIRLTTRQ